MFASTVLLAFTALTDGAQPCATFCPAIYMPVCCTNDGKNITFGNNCEAGRYECMNRGTRKL